MSEPTVIEGEARDVTPGATSVALTTPAQTSVARFDTPERDPLRSMGLMSPEDFGREVQVIKAGRDRMLQLQRELLRKDIDYGTIPGTKKDSLYQPGAEQLAMFHRLIPEHEQRLVITPGADGWPEEVAVHTRTSLHLGSLDGPVVGTAVASCSTYEDRYLYRSTERTCPTCGAAAIIKGNPQYAPRTHGRTGDVLPGYEGGGWLCWKKKDGCGATFPDAHAVGAQAAAKAFVDNPRGLINTITQMSAKRGFVGAIRHTLGITDLFTQDTEDMIGQQAAPDDGWGPPPDEQQGRSQPARAAQPARQGGGAQSSPPAPAPSGGKAGALATFEGPVVVEPDGLRHTPNGKVLTFAIKVGASKHNVEALTSRVELVGHLKEGVRVAVAGRRFEEDWPGRGDKPKKKVIREVDAIDVQGVGRFAMEAPAGPPEAPSEPLFDDDTLPFEPPPAEPVALTGSGEVDVSGPVRAVRWETTPQGTRFGYVELLTPDGGAFIKVAIKLEDAYTTIADEDTGTFAIKPGDVVRVIGDWNPKGTMVVSGIIGPDPGAA